MKVALMPMEPGAMLFEAVRSSSSGYAIELCPEPALNDPMHRAIQWSPSDFVGLDGGSRRLFAPREAFSLPSKINLQTAIALVHDFAHLVFWHPEFGVLVPEEWMVAWECAFIRQALGSDRRYWESSYTAMTCLEQTAEGDSIYIGDWEDPKTSPWYLEGLEVSRQLGCLDDQGRITGRRAAWSGEKDELDRPWIRLPNFGRPIAESA